MCRRAAAPREGGRGAAARQGGDPAASVRHDQRGAADVRPNGLGDITKQRPRNPPGKTGPNTTTSAPTTMPGVDLSRMASCALHRGRYRGRAPHPEARRPAPSGVDGAAFVAVGNRSDPRTL